MKFTQHALSYKELLQNFKLLLKENGLKFTSQREDILRALYDAHEHLSPETLHAVIMKKNAKSKIGIATIYRTLTLLEDCGFVTSIPFGQQGKKYELANKEHHDHMICTGCGKIIEFIDDEIEKKQQLVAQEHHFKMTHHSMQIYGLCDECQKK